MKKWQLVFYGTDTNPVRLRSPQTARPGISSPVATPVVTPPAVPTVGRDVHGLTGPVVATPFTPTFTSIGRLQPSSGPFFFPGNTGFRPSFYPNTGFPDYLQIAGSEPVTYSTSPDVTSKPTSSSKIFCPKFSLNGYSPLLLFSVSCFTLTQHIFIFLILNKEPAWIPVLQLAIMSLPNSSVRSATRPVPPAKVQK